MGFLTWIVAWGNKVDPLEAPHHLALGAADDQCTWILNCRGSCWGSGRVRCWLWLALWIPVAFHLCELFWPEMSSLDHHRQPFPCTEAMHNCPYIFWERRRTREQKDYFCFLRTEESRMMKWVVVHGGNKEVIYIYRERKITDKNIIWSRLNL